MADLLIHGGTVVDGTGAPARRADVLVDGTRITGVVDGGLAETDRTEAGTVVDATGRLVFPGFVDTHIHGDAAILTDPAAQLASLRQGVTTWILGQDGVSFAPGGSETAGYAGRYFGAINGPAPEPLASGCTVGELLAAYDGAAAVNAAYLIPAGTVRAEVIGLTGRRADDGDVAAMRALVEQGLADGAVGLSTGLDYVPGRFADAAEIGALCGPVAAAGRPYVSHIRYYEARTDEGLAEVRRIHAASGVAPHVSHFHGPGRWLHDMVEDMRSDGIDTTYDSYPYVRACSIIAMLLLPAWVQEGGIDAALERLSDPAVLARLRSDWFPTVSDVVPRVRLAYVAAPEWSWSEGMPLDAAAARARMPVGDFVCTILRDSALVASGVFGQPRSGEADLELLLRSDAHMGGSDGIPLGGHPHPRFWGAFARFLAHHTRDRGDWTWEQAAVHLASRPAQRFGLAGRGSVRSGAVADLVTVDPQRVADRATYEDPKRLASGIDDVIVSGAPVLRGGALTGTRAGRALRFGAA
ncbi:MAG: N-acyl-D-amino-acid deacylase family protein [Mycobacteriales bacterium]